MKNLKLALCALFIGCRLLPATELTIPATDSLSSTIDWKKTTAGMSIRVGIISKSTAVSPDGTQSSEGVDNFFFLPINIAFGGAAAEKIVADYLQIRNNSGLNDELTILIKHEGRYYAGTVKLEKEGILEALLCPVEISDHLIPPTITVSNKNDKSN